MHAMPRWYQQSKRRLVAGDREGAYRLLVATGKRGNLEAAATLARWMWGHEPDEHCVAILEEVERRASTKDWHALFAVHLAYSIGVGTSAREPEEIKRRAFENLKKAAKASSDSRMYLSVGLHYWQGLNSVSRDPARARAWLKAAASSGEDDAVSTYQRFLRSTSAQTASSAA